MSAIPHRSFAGGEITPELYPRTDTAKHQTSAKTLRNGYVMKHGGFSSRPGGVFVAEVKDSSKTVRLIEFVFNTSQTYVLEFGNLYMRVHKSGVQQTLAAQNITGITNANPGVLTYAGADTYANGDEVYISGITGAIGAYLNGRNFKVASVNAGLNTFQLNYLDGSAVNTTSMGSWTAGGTIAEVYTVTTPYVEADLPEIRFAQSADVVTIVHPTYVPYELARLSDTSWTLTAISFGPAMSNPQGCSSTAGAAGAIVHRYMVTAVAVDTNEESLPGQSPSGAGISAVTKASPAVVTSAAHGFADGDSIYISGIVGMTQINLRSFIIAGVTANTFELVSENSTTYDTYTSGGTAYQSSCKVAAAAPATATPNVISWSSVAGSAYYNIYKMVNGLFGYLGSALGTSFSDVGSTPDTTDSPAVFRNPFNQSTKYPSCVAYLQQRLSFGNTNDNPEGVYASRSANYKNFSVSRPSQDDDSLTFALVGSKVNQVKHLFELGKPVMLTDSGEWVCDGASDGIMKPSGINPRQQSYNGSSSRRPLIVGNTALYNQANSAIVRDLAYAFQKQGLDGGDLTTFASHLIDGYTISDWAYQKTPHSIIWCVRSDGELLSLTYNSEQQIIAWTHHDFDGTVENVCAVPEGSEYAVYLVVKRTVNSATKRYIERLSSRRISDIVDFIGMDCTLSYDGRNTASTTMTLSGGTNWDETETLTLTASAAFFASTDETYNNKIFLTGSDGSIVRFTINHYTSTTVVTGLADRTVASALRSAAVTTWSKAVTHISGLWHIEGKAVSIMGDGYVVASPNNEDYDAYTVTNGALVLDQPYAVVHIGLPFTVDLETLDIDTASGESIASRMKHVGEVTIHVKDTRGIFIGGVNPDDVVDNTDDDPLLNLVPLKLRQYENYEAPNALQTGKITQNILPEWNSNGRVFIRQVDPLPVSILAVVPDGLVPFPGGG